MRHLLVLLFIGFLFQPATADSAYWFKLREIELVTSEHHVIVRAGTKYDEPGKIEIASIGSPDQSRTAALPTGYAGYDILSDVSVVADKLLIRGTRRGRVGGALMEIYHLDTLERLDRVVCRKPQVLSPSGRFVVYEKGARKSYAESGPWSWDCPVVFLRDLWAEPDTNRVADNHANPDDDHVASDSSWPIFPPGVSDVQAYLNPALKDNEEFREYVNKGFTSTSLHAWSEDERLVAFKLQQGISSKNPSIKSTAIVVVELDPKGRPVNHHRIDDIPDHYENTFHTIEFTGSSIRLLGKDRHGLERVTWTPDPQPWQR